MTIMLVFAIVATAFGSWLLTFVTRPLAVRWQAVDHPTGGRKIHTRTLPRLGGVGIALAIASMIILGLRLHWFAGTELQPLQLQGLLTALLILLIVGVLDDRYELSPTPRLIAYCVCCAVVILSGTRIAHITHPSGGVWTVPIWLGVPLTFAWLLAVTFATKFMDGLDGLVAGQTVIGAGLIALLSFSPLFYEPSVGLLALIVLAAFLGFLPVNLHPAKQFLGETGSTLAGFTLGFLAVASGAKVATAFMALGVPLADAALVIIGRLLRGVSPFQGDDTHLHFKLVRAGLTHRQVVVLFWLIAGTFGITALGLQTKGKMLLTGAIIALTALLSFVTRLLPRKRGLFFLLVPPLALLLFTSTIAVTRTTEEWRARPRVVFVHDKRLVVELALTPIEQERGLGGRATIPNDHGMLFVFHNADIYPFWMKGMRAPIDMLWIQDGIIVEMAEQMPPPKSSNDTPLTHTPSVSADRVLELASGGVKRYHLHVGDDVGVLTMMP